MRLNIRRGSKGVIHFLNNLERDAQYKAWPKAVQTVLQPSWQLHTVAKNLYTTVAVFDPSTYDGLTAVSQMSYFIQGMIPVRFGLLLASPDMVRNGGATTPLYEYVMPHDRRRLWVGTPSLYATPTTCAAATRMDR